MVNSYGSKFGSATVEELLLAVLAAVGLKDDDFNSHLLRDRDYALHELASRGFEQGRVIHSRQRGKPRVLADHVTVEVSHANTFLCA